MALGGGTFKSQNKVLPGSYINFVSAKRASSTLSERGSVAIGVSLDWGVDDEIFKVNQSDFERNALYQFGYPVNHEKLKGIRDLFRNARTVYFYRLNSGGTKADNDLAKALTSGVRGNDLRITVQANVDETSKFDVTTLLENEVVDKQTVATAGELVRNYFVEFKDVTLAAVVAKPLTGGTNSSVTGASHQTFLDKVESYTFNALGCLEKEEVTKKLYTAFTQRMRETVGVKFQTVLYNFSADYEGIVNVKNKAIGGNETDLIYWATGVVASTPVNKSATNKIYDGELVINVDYSQRALEDAMLSGYFMLHKAGDNVCVLADINSLTTATENKNNVFKENQTVRVMDQIANDIAVLYSTKFLGKISNNDSGRISLWSDIVKQHEALQAIDAIEGFSDKDVVVTPGDSKKSVVVSSSVTVMNTMEQLYMTVTVA